MNLPNAFSKIMRHTFAYVLLFASLLFNSGCASQHAGPADDQLLSGPADKTLLVRKIEYDAHGRPLFRLFLTERPVSESELFTIVQYRENRPVQSFDMMVVGRKADIGRPLAVIYKWTGDGYQGGLVIAEGIAPGSYQAASAKDAAVYLAVKAAPVVIGSVSGFVVGLIASIPETATELKNLVVDTKEVILSHTYYEYDKQDRLTAMKMYLPGEREKEAVRTIFYYRAGDRDPEQTEVMNFVEHTVRTIP